MHLYCVVQTDYDLNLALEHCALSLAIFIHDIPPHSRINDFPTRRVRLLDLKPDNVLLTEALEGKLCDLGLAQNAVWYFYFDKCSLHVPVILKQATYIRLIFQQFYFHRSRNVSLSEVVRLPRRSHKTTCIVWKNCRIWLK